MEDFIHPSKCKGKVQKIKEENLKGLFSNLLPATHLFGMMWSIHAGWLQQLPILPKLLPKFSFPHNFQKNYQDINFEKSFNFYKKLTFRNAIQTPNCP
jgi:hypothetical protein